MHGIHLVLFNYAITAMIFASKGLSKNCHEKDEGWRKYASVGISMFFSCNPIGMRGRAGEIADKEKSGLQTKQHIAYMPKSITKNQKFLWIRITQTLKCFTAA